MVDATSPSSSLADYVATLIKEKGFQTLTPEVEEELKKDLLEQLHDTLVAKTLDRLSDQQVKELNTFLDVNPTDEQLQKFIATKIPNASEFITQVLLSFRRTYLGLEM